MSEQRRDRVTNKPRTLRALLRWAQQQYGLEEVPRIHNRDIADDGAPDHTHEFKAYIGMTGHDEKPDDWRRIASRLDADGFYRYPLRRAIEAVPGERRRSLLRALLTNVLYPKDVCEAEGIPAWCADDVVYRALSLLWDNYSDRPIPGPSRKSDAQLDAEHAA